MGRSPECVPEIGEYLKVTPAKAPVLAETGSDGNPIATYPCFAPEETNLREVYINGEESLGQGRIIFSKGKDRWIKTCLLYTSEAETV